MARLHPSTIMFGSILLAGTFAYATPAAAQATRTWVSGVGDDANPCSRTAPCKTFAGAISKTATGGEINCLDPGGYGAVTITKSITIDCTATLGSILSSATQGILVNGANVNVVIRGITINGAGTTPGTHGIRFIQGASLIVQNVYIQGAMGASPNGNGILFAPNTAAELFVYDTQIVNSGPPAGGSGSGIELAPGVSGSVRAVISNVVVANHSTNGIRLNSANGTVSATIDRSDISGNASGIVLNATSAATLMLVNSDVSNNSGNGILASGANARARVGNTTITGNGTGVLFGGGASVNTYGNNRLNGNTTDGAFTLPPIAEQ